MLHWIRVYPLDFLRLKLVKSSLAWVICTEVLALKPGDDLIVNACGSSIGRICAQFSRILGFRLIAVTRNNIYTEELTQLGASYVINTERTSPYDAVMELTNGRGAKAAIDSIGGPSGTNLAYCVSPNGIFLTIGLLSGIPVNWAEIMNNNKINTNVFHLRHGNKKSLHVNGTKHFINLYNLFMRNS